MSISKLKKREKNKELAPAKHFFWIGVVFFAVVVIGVVIFFWYFSQKPVSSVPHEVEIPVAEDKGAVFERFEGKYLSFRHGGNYSLKSQQEEPDANKVILETAFLVSSEANSKKIAMTIESLDGRRMEDSANYNLRKVYADKYQEEKFSSSGISGTSFVAKDADIFEKVIFIARENYLAEIALSGPWMGDESMEKEFIDIVESIQWKK